MKFIEREKYRHSTMANQTEVTRSRTNDLSEEILPPPPPESTTIQAVSPFVQIAILIIVCFAVYYPILFNDFLYYWDDQWQVMNHYTKGGINLSNLWSIFTEYYGGQYSPVNETIYLFLYSLFGYNPMVFHLTSLLFHVGCVCLAYIIIIRIFAQTKHQTTVNASAIAFVTVLLFAIHPMNVESVAWISASKIVVYAFFYLLATYTYLIYLDRKKIGLYILTILLFALSFGGKEQAVTFPVWLLMLHWMLGHSFKERKVWVDVAPFFALSIAFGIITMLSQAAGGGGVLSDVANYPLWQRVILGCYSFIEYIVKFTIPYNLMYIYPFPMLVGETLPTWMLLYPTIIFLISVPFWNHLKKTPFSVGFTFFFIHIFLMLHIVPMPRFMIVADRYIYLPSIGFSFIVAWYFIALVTTKKRTVRKIIISCIVCVSLCFSVSSNIRCRDWKDSNSIKKELLELLKKRDDYIPPIDLKKLLEELKNEGNEDNDVIENETSTEKSEYQNNSDDSKKKTMSIYINYLFTNYLNYLSYEKNSIIFRYWSDSSILCF